MTTENIENNENPKHGEPGHVCGAPPMKAIALNMFIDSAEEAANVFIMMLALPYVDEDKIEDFILRAANLLNDILEAGADGAEEELFEVSREEARQFSINTIKEGVRDARKRIQESADADIQSLNAKNN